MKSKFCFLFALLASVGFTVKADSYPLATYNVVGSLTLVGNSVCSGPCIETVNFSFVLKDIPYSNSPIFTNYEPIIQGAVTINSSGPLATFSAQECCGANAEPNIGFLEFFNGPRGGSGTDEIDLWINFANNPSVPPTSTYADNYYCRTNTCVKDFEAPSLVGTGIGPGTNYVQFTAIPVSTPEPATIVFLLIGLLAAIAFSRKFASKRELAQSPN